MFSYEELKARIEHEKNSLRFYVLYWHILKKDMSEEELERMIDFHLDRLIELLRLKGCQEALERGLPKETLQFLYFRYGKLQRIKRGIGTNESGILDSSFRGRRAGIW